MKSIMDEDEVIREFQWSEDPSKKETLFPKETAPPLRAPPQKKVHGNKWAFM